MTEIHSDSIEAQIENLQEGVRVISSSVEALSAERFLGPLGNWTPRDVVAHLIGWNRYSVTGSRQLLKGEQPFYDEDPGEDYSNVNARLVSEYSSRDRTELLAEHAQAAAELAKYLRSLSPHDWQRETGVSFDGDELVIRQNVDWLIEDHHYHGEQLRALAEA